MNEPQSLLMLKNAPADPDYWGFKINTEATTLGEKTTGVPFSLSIDTSSITQFFTKYPCEIDWGDGSTTILDGHVPDLENTLVHEYATAGIYNIVITASKGVLLGLSTVGSVTSTQLKHVYYFRRTVVEITHVLPKLKTLERKDITHCQYFFMGCQKLTTLPSNLFSKCTQIISFMYCFQQCFSLVSLPTTLFADCTKATNFSACFKNCSKLTTIPAHLFKDCTSSTNFSSCFYYCTSLTKIPTGIFDNCTNATDFSYCFFGCNKLVTIPDYLFRYNKRVTKFERTFQNCNAVKLLSTIFHDSPTENTTRFSEISTISFAYCFYRTTYTGDPLVRTRAWDVLPNAPVLWECTYGPTNNVIPTKTKCFAGEGNLAASIQNYTDIPEAWK